jgi:hypothetical protein
MLRSAPKKKNAAAANLRSWRVIIMRSRGEYLGSVEAAAAGLAPAPPHETEAAGLLEMGDRRGALL